MTRRGPAEPCITRYRCPDPARRACGGRPAGGRGRAVPGRFLAGSGPILAAGAVPLADMAEGLVDNDLDHMPVVRARRVFEAPVPTSRALPITRPTMRPSLVMR